MLPLLGRMKGSGDRTEEPRSVHSGVLVVRGVQGLRATWPKSLLQEFTPHALSRLFREQQEARVLGGSQTGSESQLLPVGRLDNLTQPQPLHLQNGDNDRTPFTRAMGEFRERIPAKHSARHSPDPRAVG